MRKLGTMLFHLSRLLYSSQKSPNKGGITRLNHIAVAVTDASGHIAFYKNTLRLPVSERLAQPEHGVYTTFVDVGNVKIELLEPLGEHSPIANFIKKNPKGGIHHFCFEVKDLEKTVGQLAETGIKPLAPPKPGAHGNPVVFLHPKDCQGTLTELEQVPPKP